MRSKQRNLAAKATLVFNMHIDANPREIKEFEKKLNQPKDAVEFYDFTFDHKKIKELKILRAKKVD